MDKAKILRFARSGIVIFVILVGMVWANTWYRGRTHYASAENYFKDGNYKDAITEYGTAVRMYTPLGGYVPASLNRLWEIGDGYEKAGKYDWSLIAFRELRSSIYAIRSFYTPYGEWIPRSDERIKESLALQKQKEQASAKSGAAPSGNE